MYMPKNSSKTKATAMNRIIRIVSMSSGREITKRNFWYGFKWSHNVFPYNFRKTLCSSQ